MLTFIPPHLLADEDHGVENLILLICAIVLEGKEGLERTDDQVCCRIEFFYDELALFIYENMRMARGERLPARKKKTFREIERNM